MPDDVLVQLALIAAILAAYSLACFFLAPADPRPYLAALIVANALYCSLTAALVVLHLSELSGWGIAYFVAEIAVILVLIVAELRVRSSRRP